jgi:hypothetical protein
VSLSHILLPSNIEGSNLKLENLNSSTINYDFPTVFILYFQAFSAPPA